MAGRPSKYKAEYVKTAKKLCELGATIPDMAEAFGVAQSTISLWAVKYKPFSEAIRVGKETPDNRVERALYERAVGSQHPHDDIRVVDGVIVVTPTIKHYPPDTKAAMVWLFNRMGDKWHPAPTDNGGAEDMAAALRTIADKLPG